MNIQNKIKNTKNRTNRVGQENSKPIMILTDAVDSSPICKEQETRMTEAVFLWSFSSKSKYKYDTGCKYIQLKHKYPSASWSYTSKNFNDGDCLFFKKCSWRSYCYPKIPVFIPALCAARFNGRSVLAREFNKWREAIARNKREVCT